MGVKFLFSIRIFGIQAAIMMTFLKKLGNDSHKTWEWFPKSSGKIFYPVNVVNILMSQGNVILIVAIVYIPYRQMFIFLSPTYGLVYNIYMITIINSHIHKTNQIFVCVNVNPFWVNSNCDVTMQIRVYTIIEYMLMFGNLTVHYRPYLIFVRVKICTYPLLFTLLSLHYVQK